MPMKLAEILKDSNYKLSQFREEDVLWLEESIFTKETRAGEKPYVKCLVRNKDIQLKPEEAVRQLYLKTLTDRYGYSTDRMVVEYGVKFGRETKKADIAIMDADRPTVPYIIVELKKPKEKDGKDQLKSYCNATGAPIGVWTNGDAVSRWHRKDPNYFERITDIPKASQTLEDILQITFTLEDLIANDRLMQERMSLRALIEEMEDEVLANAGVDVFEEVFKLIFTKLYDEWLSGQGNNRSKRILEFRNTGQTESKLKTKIQDLFDDAKQQWEGVFSEDSKISLTPSHLAVCVRSLENVKLFNSNLDVIDEAFEYLVNQSSKGEKGQYFTPRYVIDLCVKMLNPQEDEYMIDTAAGSSGFPVHTIFHVWRQILADEGLEASHLFTMETKPHRCYEYVQKRVFAIDFDEKSVRVARTLNLIAGDGQTNVLHLNTLDFDLWDETTKEEYWNDTYNEGFKRLKKLRAKRDSYKEFQFDVLMANPPFAGDIKESRIIARYDLGKKPSGKWQNKIGRDILFIERNLDFLKPGGRMAIVLPQGRFNNSTDKQIRDYIAERCRILAVVGLHGNTFKPHTGTKTSVLFVQKWNDDPKAGALCPRQDDYNIFFATMSKTGKDNSGEKIYRRIIPEDEESLSEEQKTREFLLDPHGHLVVDHDLYNHDGMTEDGIAEAFIEFAKKENLSFFESGPSMTPFDQIRYRQLMDGLEAGEVNFSLVLEDNDSFRFDSEYFKKEYLDKLSNIKNLTYKEIKDFAYVTDGIHESIDFDEESTINLISAKSPKSNVFDLSSNEYISQRQHERNPRTELKIGDVIISTVGTIGNCAVVDESILPANSDRHVGIVRIENSFKPYFLSTFLLTKYGRFQTLRESTGNVQLNLFIYKIKTLKIPELPEEFQTKVQDLVLLAHQLLDRSKDAYQEAEDLLLSELGLKDWQPTEENIAVKSFAASFGTSRRLDAEHYKPKYDQAMEQITSLNPIEVAPLDRFIFDLTNGQTPLRHDLSVGEVKFLTAEHIYDFKINYDTDKRVLLEHHRVKLCSTQLSGGEVLVTIKGRIGNAAVVNDEDVEEPVNINQDVARIILHPGIHPYYIAGFLNSKIGKLLVEKFSTGQINPFLGLGNLRQLPIPIFDQELMNTLGEHIEQKANAAYQAEQTSKALLEIAKVGVEKAIETDEATATTWIHEQLEAMGVELPIAADSNDDDTVDDSEE